MKSSEKLRGTGRARLRRDDLLAGRRLLGIAASLGLLPFQFIPGWLAVRGKQGERDRITRYSWALGMVRDAPPREVSLVPSASGKSEDRL